MLPMSEDNPVSFRISEEMKKLVAEQAEEDGVTFSEKVRQYCRDGVENEGRQEAAQ